MAKHWDKEGAKRDYIAGASPAEVAAKYGVSERTIFRYIRKEGWDQERDKYQAALTEQVLAKVKEEAIETRALLFQTARYILERYWAKCKAGGMTFTPSDVKWAADILLQLDAAGRGEEPRQIIVKWVADEGEGDQDCLQSPPKAEDVP